MKRLVVFPVILAISAALLAAGCGGGGGGGTDPASVMPAGAPFYMDFTVHPEGAAKANIEALAQKVAGVSDLGGLIVSELEKSASRQGGELDFGKEVEPWLGKEGGLFLREYKGKDFKGYGAAVQVEDEAAARAFVERQLEDEAPQRGSYNGVDFEAQPDGTTFGVFDGLIVVAEDEATFESMVDASEGENLAGQESFTSALSHAPSTSAADAFIDVGGLIEESGGRIDAETELFLEALGIEPKEATAVASAIPGSDNLEIDLSTNLGGDNPPSGDASELLGALPAGSVGALASAEFGKRFNEAVDQIDRQGIPGKVPPHQLKKGLKQSGIDLEAIAGSIGDVGLFVEGSNRRNLSGAVVLTTESATQAKNTVSNIGLFLRATGTPGITALNGEASGFSVHSSGLGRRPLVVIAKGERIVVGYGLKSATAGLEGGGETLAETPRYKEAVTALGSTPIAAYVDGPAALRLASALIPPGDEKFRKAKRYLTKIDYLALGSEASGGLATAKLIVGVGR